MFRKIASLFLAFVMAVSLNGIPAAMAESSVVPGGTADLFESAAANGLLTGIAGEAKPEDNLTRAQMASVLTSAFGAAEQASLSGYTDMDESAWYYAGMAKAVQMGVFLDDGSTLNPEGLVTREEAFSALCRVFKLPGDDAAALDGLKDKDSISPDALDAAAALLKAGYIAAEDGYLNPKTNMTLAEFLQTLDTMVKCYLNLEGTYTSVPDGGVMINVPDVTLKDVVVKGDLILGDGIGDGSVTLDSVTVTGRTLIRGGGAHSIRITGTSSLQSIVIARVNGELRVFAEDGTEIGEVSVDGKDNVIIEGNFASVTLASDNVTVTAINARIGSAGITGENSRIIVAAGSDVNKLTVDGANAVVEVAGTVTDIVVNGGGTAISGEGRVSEVSANVNDIKVTTPDTLVTAAAGTSGVTAGTRDVPEGTTVNTTPEYDGGAGGGNKPSVTSVSPAQGPASGGTEVTVKGKYFTDASSVTFGGKAAASFKVISSTEIAAVTPAGTAGAAIVAVTTPYGTGTKASAFTYAAAPVITSVSPNAGPNAGGAAVTITGTGFTGASSVTFGGTAAASYTVVSDTQITAVTPAGVKGPADITVTAPGGTVTKSSAYSYIPVPSITSIGPGTGPLAGGGTVIITGSGFAGAASVTFGGSAASYTIVSDTSITAVAPARAAGPADVAVTTPGGTVTKAAAYMYAPVPSITSLSPNAGPISGGTAVTIAGSGFMGADLVTFGGRAAVSYTVNSDTSITAVAPWGDAGPAAVTVTTAGGTGTKTAAYTYCPAVNVNFTVPSVGPLSGGNVVAISGTGLEHATAVTFGGVNALSFTVISGYSIQATVPAGAAGPVDVTVTTPGGTGTAIAAYTYIPAPSITTVSPGAGPVAGGTMVNITGTGFLEATAVTFGGIPAASYTVVSDTVMSAAAPAGTAGAKDVAVTAMGGTGTASAAYTYIPAPAITSVSPNAGTIFGGNTVTISGSGFTGTTVVLFGLTPVMSFTVVSDTTISAITPSGAPGAADIAVTTVGGTGIKTGGFTYALPPTISTLSPDSGTALGGNTVTITGMNLTYATAVTFGLVPASSFTVNSNTQITATAPAGAAGTVDVRVATPGGSATYIAAYTYVPAPAVTSISSNIGPQTGGNTATITGTGFTGATSVNFGATPATFTVDSDTQITAVAPAGIGVAQVTVTTAGGTSNGVSYTYVPVPAVTTISPGSGPETGGSIVVITGTGFTDATSVYFGFTPAMPFVVNSDTRITAVTPAGTGTKSVKVTTAGGTSNGVWYTYVQAPTATTITPNSGSETGGNTVTITGTAFTGATEVSFGGTPATSFTVVSATQIMAVSPAGTGMISVTVTTAGGTSNGVSYTYVPAPAVTSITSNTGPQTGGNTATITGTGFTGATSVNFGATPAAFTVDSDTQITAVAPAGTSAVSVTVTTAAGTSNGVSYTYAPVPIAASIAPSAGPETGGTSVTITGSGFTGATLVTFGGVPATSFMVVSNTHITAIAPANDPGTVDVAVMTAGGTSNAKQYTYVPLPVISSISPGMGEDSGSTSVVITGTNLTGATAVFFGAVPATSFTVNSSMQITAAAPAGTGIVNVCVTTAGGTSNTLPYTYISAPVIGSINPIGGRITGNTTVVITGQHFTDVTAVNFGAVPALSYTIDSDTQITAISPAGTAAGLVDVTVTKMYATATKTGAFTYVTQPNITSVSSEYGSLSGGNTVTIVGENLTWVNSVSFGGTAAASFTVNSDTSITVMVPAGAEPGPVDITVSSYGIASTLVSSYNYMALAISNVDSNWGPAEGSDISVSIYGFCFTGATSVTFGGVPAVSFFVSDVGWIVAVPPAGTGTVAVTVTTPNGSATKAGAYTYVTTPTITLVSPNAGPMAGGTLVTITGTNLTQTASVSFGGIAATSFTVTSPTTITAPAPANFAGTVDVAVTTAYGSATKTSAYTYE